MVGFSLVRTAPLVCALSALLALGCGGSDDGGGNGDGGSGGTAGSGGVAGTGGMAGTGGTSTLVTTVACTNSVTAETSILEWQLTVRAGLIESGEPFTATLDGVVTPGVEEVLGGIQSAQPMDLTEMNLVDLNATVHVRSGASGADITLGPEPLPYQCGLDHSVSCDPANDLPSIPGGRRNTDCQPEGDFNPCGRFIPAPISDDCTPSGTCAQLGKTGQCQLNGFCTVDFQVPLGEALGQYTADSQGDVLFGWDDQSTGATIRESGPNQGTWILPPAFHDDPVGPIGGRFIVGGIRLHLECTMGVDSKGEYGVDSLDFLSSPTPDSLLISFPIL